MNTCILSSPHFVLTSYWGIFFLCFAYFHLRSRRSEDVDHIPLTTCFVYITYFLEMLTFQVSFCRFIIYVIINLNFSFTLIIKYLSTRLTRNEVKTVYMCSFRIWKNGAYFQQKKNSFATLNFSKWGGSPAHSPMKWY
jgi:hypothetical protein